MVTDNAQRQRLLRILSKLLKAKYCLHSYRFWLWTIYLRSSREMAYDYIFKKNRLFTEQMLKLN